MPTLQNSKLIPKFELLKAYATGKYKDKEAYEVALRFCSSFATEVLTEGKQSKRNRNSN